VKVEFECILCGERATATVADDARAASDDRLETLRECPNCDIETIWIEA
jgi:hypothetical protein